MTFSPTQGLLVEYKGTVGNIKFIDESYLTLCTQPKDKDMIGDICVVVYRYEWDKIKLIGSHHNRN